MTIDHVSWCLLTILVLLWADLTAVSLVPRRSAPSDCSTRHALHQLVCVHSVTSATPHPHPTLTHPHTDLDVSMTSHIGASDNRYSAAVDTWYLTSRRQRKNMALRGEIDQLRRQISMEVSAACFYRYVYLVRSK